MDNTSYNQVSNLWNNWQSIVIAKMHKSKTSFTFHWRLSPGNQKATFISTKNDTYLQNPREATIISLTIFFKICSPLSQESKMYHRANLNFTVQKLDNPNDLLPKIMVITYAPTNNPWNRIQGSLVVRLKPLPSTPDVFTS